MRAGHPRRNPAFSESGFTLLELILAIAILSTGLLVGILPMQYAAVTSNTRAFQRYTASVIADNFLSNFNLLYDGTDGFLWSSIVDKPGGDGWTDDRVNCPAPVPDPVVTPAKQPFYYHSVYRNSIRYELGWRADTVVGFPESVRVRVFVRWKTGAGPNDMSISANKGCQFFEEATIKYCNPAGLSNDKGLIPGGCPT